MRSWGVVRPLAAAREPSGRAEVHARWEDLAPGATRPKVDAERSRSQFVDAPPAPSGWRTATGLLVLRTRSQTRRGGPHPPAWARQRDACERPTLLSQLAERGGGAAASLTDGKVLSLCFEDEAVSLRRARRAGALAGVARAVHTALVQ